MTDKPVPDFISAMEAAAVLSVTERHIRGLIAKGSLPAYRLGKKAIRVSRSDVLALLVPIAAGTPQDAT